MRLQPSEQEKVFYVFVRKKATKSRQPFARENYVYISAYMARHAMVRSPFPLVDTRENKRKEFGLFMFSVETS